MQRERLYYLDILRIFAMISMMLLHVAASQWTKVDIHSFHWQVLNVYDALVRFCVPVFIMISGALFLDPDWKVPVKTLYTKYIFHIIVTFMFWSTGYAGLWFLKHFREDGAVSRTIVRLIAGHYHLWFLYTIVGLYIITPFLRRFVRSKFLVNYFLTGAFLLGILVPTLQKFPLLEKSTVLTDKLNLLFFSGYSFYFVLGYALKKSIFSKKVKYAIYVLGILGFLITVLGTKVISYYRNEADQTLYGYLTPNCAMCAIAVFVFFQDVFGGKKFTEKANNQLTALAEISFGMYLVHDVFNALFNTIGFHSGAFNPIISVPVITICVVIGSGVVVVIMRKIPIINRLWKFVT